MLQRYAYLFDSAKEEILSKAEEKLMESEEYFTIAQKNKSWAFGNAIRIIRQIQKIKQYELAEKVSKDERALRSLEAELTDVSVEQAMLFAKVFNVEVNLIYELAKDQGKINNVVHTAKRDGIVVNQGQTEASQDILSQWIKDLEHRVHNLETTRHQQQEKKDH
jgi:transcriptional regulator with XRE-family HTH domain